MIVVVFLGRVVNIPELSAVQSPRARRGRYVQEVGGSVS